MFPYCTVLFSAFQKWKFPLVKNKSIILCSLAISTNKIPIITVKVTTFDSWMSFSPLEKVAAPSAGETRLDLKDFSARIWKYKLLFFIGQPPNNWTGRKRKLFALSSKSQIQISLQTKQHTETAKHTLMFLLISLHHNKAAADKVCGS